jgi:deazaflavin-dependent oxidoreductase (nitroreductase family)
MKNLFIRLFTDFNALLIRLSRGRVGARLGTQTILILHTTGRKSGRPRSTPVAYFFFEGDYLLVGSNWGREYQADWVLNLQKQPRARVDVHGRRLEVLARVAEGDEYTRLWAYATGRHPPYLEYQKATRRTIPIIVLQPVN